VGAVGKVREMLKELEARVDSEAFVLFDGSEVWLSEAAETFIADRKIKKEDLLDRLEWDRHRLSGACCFDVETVMMRLPDKPGCFLVILRDSCPEGRRNFNLTPKEKEVIESLAMGSTNKEIAELLGISPGTVNAHLDSIYRKLGVSNRLEASFVALKEGLILPKSTGPPAKKGRPQF
jgi:DNA-binding CsgD family transcriptional regulator